MIDHKYTFGHELSDIWKTVILDGVKLKKYIWKLKLCLDMYCTWKNVEVFQEKKHFVLEKPVDPLYNQTGFSKIETWKKQKMNVQMWPK